MPRSASAEMGVAEIHGYPLRPEGFEEPLFPTDSSRRAIAEHLLEAPWLSRASELRKQGGHSAHSVWEPIEVRSSAKSVEIFRVRKSGGSSWRRRPVVEVLERWREVRRWWDEESCVDRMAFRVLLSGGAVVELALERPGGWFLAGIAD